jgi:hypothetical protein
MIEKSAAASLRVCTDEMQLDFISLALGVVPSAQHLKGDLRSKRNPESSVFEKSLWIYESPLSDSCELSEHIDAILTLLELRQEALNAIRTRITEMDIFSMFSSENGQGSMELGAALLQRLANQHLDLIVDLYPPPGIEADDTSIAG